MYLKGRFGSSLGIVTQKHGLAMLSSLSHLTTSASGFPFQISGDMAVDVTEYHLSGELDQ